MNAQSTPSHTGSSRTIVKIILCLICHTKVQYLKTIVLYKMSAKFKIHFYKSELIKHNLKKFINFRIFCLNTFGAGDLSLLHDSAAVLHMTYMYVTCLLWTIQLRAPRGVQWRYLALVRMSFFWCPWLLLLFLTVIQHYSLWKYDMKILAV